MFLGLKRIAYALAWEKGWKERLLRDLGLRDNQLSDLLTHTIPNHLSVRATSKKDLYFLPRVLCAPPLI